MFTVCPKCALTLVVTAADLRVAQGYVRCGRCSNVFNALARLSEDRNAAAAAAASQGVPPSSTGVHPRPQPTAVPSAPSQASPTPARPPPATGSFTFTRPPDIPSPAARAPQQPGAAPTRTSTVGTVSAARPPDSYAPAGRFSPPTPTSPAALPPAGSPPARPPAQPQQAAAPPRPSQSAPVSPAASPPPSRLTPPPPLEMEGDDDDVIPEDALEFNPDAADVNQVFVEPPPNPEWTAATGTFKAIVLKSEEVFHGPAPSAPAPTPISLDSNPLGSSSIGLSSSFGADEFELDPDFLSATAEMRKLQTGVGHTDAGVQKSASFSFQPAPPAQTPNPPSARLAPRGPFPEAPPQTPFRASGIEIAPQPQFRATPAESPPGPQQRSAPPDTQVPARPAPGETQSRQQPKPPPAAPLDADTFFERQVVSRPPARTAAVKAFGLDAAAEPPPERLAVVARSRVAPGPVELEPTPLARTAPNLVTLWSAGAGALVILLAAQIVNHYRNDLAATAQFNKPITALYAALGVHLTPLWDLHAYDVRQLGASVDSASAGQIMVRASVKNGARQPQPMPLLRVTLQDRFGNRIAARDVPPGSYLPRATADTAFLPAGQRIDAEMAFVDPGSNAVGFEIDACLPAPAGGIACANDPTSRY